MKPSPPLDGVEFARWRTEADSALQAATAQVDAGLHNWACFLAEQATQLAVKALLHGVGRPAWGHDLVRLGGEASDAVATLWPEASGAGLRRLSRHYITARYPDAVPSGTPGEHYGPEDTAQALADARTTLGVVDDVWAALVL